ncbi:MAG: hypothetical protein RLZ25_929 [Pseudomonadota bacterium]
MQLPLEITFHGVEHSDAVEARIREKAAKLEQHCHNITSCRVAVEAEHHHQHHGNLYKVRIDIAVPHKQIVVSRDHHDKQEHQDIYVALRDAFAAATRQLEDYVRIHRGEVKSHAKEVKEPKEVKESEEEV